jgi:hypothetical protein
LSFEDAGPHSADLAAGAASAGATYDDPVTKRATHLAKAAAGAVMRSKWMHGRP